MSTGKKLSKGKGISGIGRFRKTRIDTIQNYYGCCISDNQGDVEIISSGVRSILGHVSSKADKLKHEDCPKGSTLWCSYHGDIANGTPERWLIKNYLARAIVKNKEQVFEKFGDKEFLTAVEKCYTINVNESFHVVRSMCP